MAEPPARLNSRSIILIEHMERTSSTFDPGKLLESHGFKRTPVRVQLLETLSNERLPLRIERLQERLPDADPATLYRALEALTEVGILERSDFQHGHAHYELRVGRPHHHHLICSGCGAIADVPATTREHLNQQALKATRGFARIDRHALEFYGLCAACD